jgi:hypothetical protein
VSAGTLPVRPEREGVTTPPLAPLHELLARLEAAGLRHALGASGLLAALGLVDRVNDWDVTVAASMETLERACAGLAGERFGNDGVHADHKLTFHAERVELIADFAFFTPGGVVRIPVETTATWRGVPVGSPTAWAAAYALMGELEDSPRRRERADLLFAWLGGRAPESAVLDALLAQPLTDSIAARLRALRS